MQIAQSVTYIQLPWSVSLTKVRLNAFLAIEKMYSLAYTRHVPRAFSARINDAENSFTPNELRLLDLVSSIMTDCLDVCVVHCGDRTFLFGTHDEYAGSCTFKYEHVSFIE